MAEPTFSGVGVALLTFFDESGTVDVDATIAHAVRVAGSGVRAVLVAGTTGEADTLTDPERLELIAAARAALPDDVTVIAGASGAWARAASARAVAAREAGADTVLVAPARGGVQLQAFFDAVTEAVGETSRVIGYHNPGPLGVPGIPVETLMDLPIGGVKDSSGDPGRLLDELDTWDGQVYLGSSAILSFGGPLGAAGALLALANVVPEECVQAFDGDAKAQRALTGLVRKVRQSGLAALKAATAERFGTSTVRRLALS
ncbi:dihydrodipicolinate synthase family protein [Tenggerimyces flavus]|uniref:Dihydrodipicolinate synthase family protein n=1 Tax=Tenggerimyces flavus TaxID=1708749 RepID=A0ABV7YG79_9ACTN|nr:dihydrodipicolinate synthase family protein [Tenggerimyces flavus]MBM7788068.1 4-hydroxy-tetrahydrodipicolinate synthase [Tenggerimyces flavus]